MARCRPGSSGVYPSVARITYSARTVPCVVRSRPGAISVTGVCSYSRTPCLRTAAARPRASRAGWMAAQCGVYVAPSTPDAATRSAASARFSSRRSASPKPNARYSATSSWARWSWLGERASMTVPPLAQWQSMSSAAATRPTSSTVSCMARYMATAACVPGHPLQLGQRRREQRRAPAAVPAGRAEAGDVLLAHRDPQSRAGLGQVVRGPQPGEAGPGDGHVHVLVAGQRVAGDQCRPAWCRARKTATGMRDLVASAHGDMGQARATTPGLAA